MKTLYLECNMGAAGDMLAAALLEIHAEPVEFVNRLNALGLPGVEFISKRAVKCGISGTHLTVTVNGVEEEGNDVYHHEHSEHHHNHGHGEQNHNHEHGEQKHNHEHHEHGKHHHDHEHGEHNNNHEHHEHGGYLHNHEHGEQKHNHEHHEHGKHNHNHEHHGLHEIEHIVSDLHLPDKVKTDVLSVYRLIAEAESHVHGKHIDEIHFHEVGTLDAIADIIAVCMLIHELAPERIIVSPVHVGYGEVNCAHGMLPVPAPATAWILRNVPTYGGKVYGELCTPTGAALIKHFATEFGVQPPMRIESIGYGCGKKDFEYANCVRAMMGETFGSCDSIVELSCNLDDMTPEALGFATERLLEAGALDVYTIPVGMKKNRPGVLLTCMCRHEQRDMMLRLLFLYTSTLGIRESECNRFILNRSVDSIDTQFGRVRIKKAEGWGVKREKIEYEDLALIARKYGISLAQAAERIKNEESPEL